ncbi:hypothetical protein L9F63_007178, partial [Diploptera punctata]
TDYQIYKDTTTFPVLPRNTIRILKETALNWSALSLNTIFQLVFGFRSLLPHANHIITLTTSPPVVFSKLRRIATFRKHSRVLASPCSQLNLSLPLFRR